MVYRQNDLILFSLSDDQINYYFIINHKVDDNMTEKRNVGDLFSINHSFTQFA